jgi:hypothetical protein
VFHLRQMMIRRFTEPKGGSTADRAVDETEKISSSAKVTPLSF